MHSRAPLITAIVLLLLPVLYVGSYLALVTPGYRIPGQFNNYRMGDEYAERFFWPLEQSDRKLRPKEWGYTWEAPATSGIRFTRREAPAP